VLTAFFMLTVILLYCAASQVLAALAPVKPCVTWAPAAFSILPHDLRTGLPAAIANFIVAADEHITQLQRARAALQQQAGVRQGVVRHYSLRQQQGGSSSGSVVGSVLQAADAAVGWLQEQEQQRLLQRVQKAKQLQQQQQVHPAGLGSRAESVGICADSCAAAASSAVQLQARGQSAEAESVLTQQAVQQHFEASGCGEEDLAAVRKKLRQLEAELASLQQREAQLAAGSATSLW
jgi:hypothetical protein